MSAPVIEKSSNKKKDLRSDLFIYYFWSEGVTTSEMIHKRKTFQFGDNCVSQRKAYKWMEGIKGRRTNVGNDGHSVRHDSKSVNDGLQTGQPGFDSC
jgi:hypothetical protein